METAAEKPVDRKRRRRQNKAAVLAVYSRIWYFSTKRGIFEAKKRYLPCRKKERDKK